MITQKYGIHWFRRDLRIVGNPALIKNLKQNNGSVLGVFFFDAKFLSRKDFSHNRFGLFLKTLKALKSDLQKSGGDLLVFDAIPQKGFLDLFKILEKASHGLPSTISFNRDYEPFALKRDKEIISILSEYENIEIFTERDHLIIEPHELKKPDGGYYQIYTPFSRRWLEIFKTKPIQDRIETAKIYLKEPEQKLFKLKWRDISKHDFEKMDALNAFIKENSPKVTVPLPDAGFSAAYKKLLNFKKKLSEYETNRNFPAKNANSGLSIYLKNGSINTALIFAVLKPDLNSQFTKELIWREFYYHILAHQPRVEHEAFLTQYKNIQWENDKKLFEAWKYGKTGFPIVDAGMRQLLTTGLMHNRVRMIVASFLTKDLLINWRWGEQWFMQNLLDGDLSANNGGWQWAASTGCDAQPYFRIFNPALQSKRFDSSGEYIRRFVPELKNLSSKDIHEPNEKTRPNSYPKPIVNHLEQKRIALSLYNK